MSKSKGRRELSYEARARMADNLFLLRRRAEYSQEELAERARVSAGQIGSIESGKVLGMLDTKREASGGALAHPRRPLAGVTWAPGEFEFEIDAGYKVEFEMEGGGPE